MVHPLWPPVSRQSHPGNRYRCRDKKLPRDGEWVIQIEINQTQTRVNGRGPNVPSPIFSGIEFQSRTTKARHFSSNPKVNKISPEKKKQLFSPQRVTDLQLVRASASANFDSRRRTSFEFPDPEVGQKQQHQQQNCSENELRKEKNYTFFSLSQVSAMDGFQFFPES